MEDDPINLESILGQASGWTFAGDFQLLKWMNKLSKDLESKATKTTENLNRLNNNIKCTNVGLENVANSLTALQYGNQFVECRVQDDDETSASLGNEEKNNGVRQNGKPSSREILSAFLDNNLKVLRNCHEKYTLDIDDSDEEDDVKAEKTCIFQPINPYNERPLPHIFGSKEWHDKWHVGLSYDQHDNCYSGDEISEAFSESSSSGAADNDSYETNSECASSFSAGNDNFGGNFEVRNATSFGHFKGVNTDPVSESSSAHSSNAKISNCVSQGIVAGGVQTRSESASSINSKNESSLKPIVSNVASVVKPGISKSYIPPYADLFANPEPPEDLGSTSPSTPSIASHISRKPVNLFNDDDDDAGSKRNDAVVVVSPKTQNKEKDPTTPLPKASPSQTAQKANTDASSSSKTSKAVLPENIEGGLFNTRKLPPPSIVSKTPNNLFDDDNDDDDFLSAFVKKQNVPETSKTLLSSSPSTNERSIDKVNIFGDSSQPNKIIFDDIADNIHGHDNIDLFDDGDISKTNEVFKDVRKPEGDSGENKKRISNILKSNLFDDDDDDDDDFFKTKTSISSSLWITPENKIAVQAGTDELKHDKVSPNTVLKSKSISEKNELFGDTLNSQPLVTNDIKSNTIPRNTTKLFDDAVDENLLFPTKPLEVPQKGLNVEKGGMSKNIFEDDGSSLDEEPETISKKLISPGNTDLPIEFIQPTPPNEVNALESCEKSENSTMSAGIVGCADELLSEPPTDLHACTISVVGSIEETPGDSYPAIDQQGDLAEQSDNVMSQESTNASKIDVTTQNEHDASVSKMYDFNSSLIFDEPPDDNDFFETLGKSSHTNTKYNSFDLENELYPEPDLPKMPTIEKSTEYIFSDIPPEDSDFDDALPQKTEYTVFYDDFNETLLALGRNQDQVTAHHSIHNTNLPNDEDASGSSNTKVDQQKQEEISGIKDGTSINASNHRPPIAKLQMPNININVEALLPGKVGKPTTFKTIQKQTDEESEKLLTVQQQTTLKENLIAQTPETEHILPSINKNRIRAPRNRRPSTRRARQENYRKSLLEEQLINTDNEKVQENNEDDPEIRNTSTIATPSDSTIATPSEDKKQESPELKNISDASKTSITIKEKELPQMQKPSPVSDQKNITKSLPTFFDEDEDDDNDLFRSLTSNKPDNIQFEKSDVQHDVSDTAKTPLAPNEMSVSATVSAKDLSKPVAGSANVSDKDLNKPVAGLLSSGSSKIIDAKLSSNKPTPRNEVKSSYQKIFTDSESGDDLFAELESSKRATNNARTEKPTVVAKTPLETEKRGSSKPKTISAEKRKSTTSSKAQTSLFSDDSDEDDFLKTSAMKHVPKHKPKVSSHTTRSTSIFSDIDTDEDGDLFDANRKVTKNNRTLKAAPLQVAAESKQQNKQTMKDNPLADLL